MKKKDETVIARISATLRKAMLKACCLEPIESQSDFVRVAIVNEIKKRRANEA